MRKKKIAIDPIELIREIFYTENGFSPDDWCINDAVILEVAAKMIIESLQPITPPDGGPGGEIETNAGRRRR